jgi:uncharacterized membrane protein
MPILAFASSVIGYAGALVLAAGVALALVRFLRLELSRIAGRDAHAERRELRSFLGHYLQLGLEILIAADVIGTLLDPGLEELVSLGAIVVIRAIIGLALSSELAHAKQPAQSS